MYSSTAQSMDLNSVLNKVVPVAQMIMFGAIKAGGIHFSASMRESGAAAKYLANSQNTYKDNLVIQGIIRSLSKMRGQKPDLRTLDPEEVMKGVDEINPILDAAPMQQGVQTKDFLYGLAEAVVNASGSGFMGSGERVSEGEAKFLADLKAHLSVSEPVGSTEEQQQLQERQAQQQLQQQQAETAPQAASLEAPSSAGSSDMMTQLQKLAEMKQAGILTDEEFAAAKKKVLG